MTTRRTVYGILLLCFFLAWCGAFFWLIATPAGVRWLGAFLARRAAVQFEVRQVKGSILSGLMLEDLKLQKQPFEVRVKSARLQWRPQAIFTGRLALTSVELQGVALQDNRPESEEQPDLAWPRPTIFLASLRGAIESLEVQEIVYTRLHKPPVDIGRLSCRVEWWAGRITLGNILVMTEPAVIRGNLGAGFLKPALDFDLTVDITPAGAAMKNIMLKARSVPATSPEQVASELTAIGVFNTGGKLELTGEIGLTRSLLNLRKLLLKQAGRKGNVTGEGELSFPRGKPFVRLRTRAANIDLTREIRIATDINGTANFEGAPEKYEGRFALTSRGKGWRSASLAGSFAGGGSGVKASSLAGSWLAGKVEGGLEIDWGAATAIRAEMQGKELNLSLINPEWQGTATLALSGELRWAAQKPLEGSVSGRLLSSRLLGQALTGEVEARFSRGTMEIAGLDLRGKGFSIHAAGILKERINYRADIGNLAGLIPDTRGTLQAQGWLSYRNGFTALAAQGQGRSLAGAGVNADSLTFDVLLGSGKDRSLEGGAEARGVTYGKLKLTSAKLKVQGKASDHTIFAELKAPRSELNASLIGSYQSGEWQGKIARLRGGDSAGPWGLQSPAGLRLTDKGISLSPMILRSAAGQLELAANLAWQPREGQVSAAWRRFRLGRIKEWVELPDMTGESSGNMEARWTAGRLTGLAGSLEASGTLKNGGREIIVSQVAVRLNWDERGMLATGTAVLDGKGRLEGRFSSPLPVGWDVPEGGEIEAGWQELDTSLFQDWLPLGVSLQGRVSGRAKGKLLPGRHLDVNAAASLHDGSIGWQRAKGRLDAELKNAEVSMTWQGEAASGKIDFTLKEYGRASAVFHVPLPARLPLSLDRAGKLAVSLKGRLQETGMLTSLFPGLIRESGGEMDLALEVGGTWEKPVLGGQVAIAMAGAYLPAAGIRLREARLKARLEGERVHIDSFHVASGSGNVELKAVITLRDWKLVGYSGTLKGDRFQTVYLPELRLLTNPDLSFTGTVEKMSIRGEIVIPELTAVGRQGPAMVTPSSDVVIIDAPQSLERSLPFALDLRIKVRLGDKVQVKAAGADVQLGGEVDLTGDRLDNLRAKGLIRMVKGKYNAYGVNLDISAGKLIFDGPAASPALDVLAVRKVEDATVGVLVTGTLSAPVMNLYSNPRMSDSDIMAYLALGRPLGGGEQDLSLVAKVADIILPKGLASKVQNELQRRLGLDTLGIELGAGAAGSPGAAAAGNKASAAAASDVVGQGAVARSVVTIGKYLTPKLYISYGRSLFTETNTLQLRYKFSPHWELETKSGIESGADLFYKLEFR